jgi:beta-lactamase class D
MGFDSGVLKDPHTPSLPYLAEYNRPEREHETTDPTIWLKDSIVWYSQHLTRELGMEKFQSYVDRFGYGNRDLSGNPGKNDGLTQAWLVSSRRISPVEQAQFLQKFLHRDLGVSDQAYDMTLASMPEFAAGDWKVHGKTGSGNPYKADGTADAEKQLGWFIGWADKGARKIVFVKMVIADQPGSGPMGPVAREQLLKELPALAK